LNQKTPEQIEVQQRGRETLDRQAAARSSQFSSLKQTVPRSVFRDKMQVQTPLVTDLQTFCESDTNIEFKQTSNLKKKYLRKIELQKCSNLKFCSNLKIAQI
jgi:hypothetical protein